MVCWAASAVAALETVEALAVAASSHQVVLEVAGAVVAWTAAAVQMAGRDMLNNIHSRHYKLRSLQRADQFRECTPVQHVCQL